MEECCEAGDGDDIAIQSSALVDIVDAQIHISTHEPVLSFVEPVIVMFASSKLKLAGHDEFACLTVSLIA